jgi:WD40 repeat protein/uncharacterized caspase-like protein
MMALVLVGTTAFASAKDLAAMSTVEIQVLQQRLTDAGCYTGPVDGQPSAATDQAKKICPGQDPILRIEAGMHTAKIKGVAVDATCTTMATASDDKTVRLWSLPDGNLKQIVRLPVGGTDGGMAYAVALSPDGRWLAAGGFDAALDAIGSSGLYLTDLSSGTVRHLGKFGDVVLYLAFSPDGQRIAVALGYNKGIRILDVASGAELMATHDYADESYGLAFTPDGGLITTSYDGFVRRYGPDMKLVIKAKAPDGDKPFGLSVDPSGKYIAIGYSDTPNLTILFEKTLRKKASGDVKDIKESDVLGSGAFERPAWGRDGKIWAAGLAVKQFEDTPRFFLRPFDSDGRRDGADVPVGINLVGDVQACNTGLVFGTGDPALGLISPSGQITTIKTPVTADARTPTSDSIAVSSDGQTVRFGLDFDGKNSVSFSLLASHLESLSDIVSGLVGLSSAKTDGIGVTNWLGNQHPFLAGSSEGLPPLGGKMLAILRGDYSRSLAVRPKADGFILGTEWGLYAFDSAGDRRWVVSVPAPSDGVNLAQNGNLVIAALGDGTIRWYRWSDGKELLALFVHKLDKRWVAWTPTGYYMASPGGEDLIGWHVNRGWDQPPDFFPASRFRDRFNRPDVVQKMLTTLDEDQAVVEANAEAHRDPAEAKPIEAQLPPVVRIASPREGSAVSGDSVTLDYTLRSPSGLPVDAIEVMIDGRPVSKNRGVERIDEASQAACPGLVTRGVTRNDASSSTDEVVCHITVPLSAPLQTFELGLIARSGNLASVPALVRLTFSPGSGPREARRPKLYVLAIGVSDYADPKLKLGFPAKDAEDFAKVMTGQSGGLYEGVEAKVLTNSEASRANVLSGLDWLSQTVTTGDVAMVFMAGHGVTDERGSFYYLPSDAVVGQQHLGGISQDDIKRMLVALPSKVLFFLDACHSGQAASQLDRRSAIDVNSLVNDLSASENGIVSFASSTGRELSEENSEWGHGAFTVALIEGIGGGKAGLLKNGTITLSELDAYVANRVTTLTSGRQHPVMNKPATITNFPIAEVSATQAVLTTQPEMSPAQSKATPAATPVSDDTDAKADFMIAKDINTFGGWNTFLKKYPSGFYSDLAREAKAKLEAQGSTSQPTTTMSSGSGASVAASAAADHPVAVTDCDRLASSPYDPSRPAGVAGTELYNITPEAVGACRAVVDQYPTEPRLQYQLGRALTTQGQHGEAMSWFQKGADKNFAPSMTAIGVLYSVGFGVPQDDMQAIAWYLKAAAQGDSEAERSIGLSYDNGRGVSKDKNQAIFWYIKAANHGNRNAQDELGQHFDEGDGVTQDYKQAFLWYNKAAANGWFVAQQHLAALYETGRGVEKDPQKAADLLLDAIKKGSASVTEQLVKNSSAWKVETRKAVQQLLSDQGRYTGGIDGAFGRGTLMAIVQLYRESQQNK